MGAIWMAVRGELTRRRLQAIIIAVVILLAAASSTLAIALLVESSDPYDRAFEDQHGAHLVAFMDSDKVSEADAAATAAQVGSTTSAGPWPETSALFRHGSAKYGLEVTGRDDPGGPVAQLRIADGRWPAAAGEIAITRSFAQLTGIHTGDTLQPIGTKDQTAYQVVGEVVDVEEGPATSATQWSWVTSSALPSLATTQAPSWEMAYRFASNDPGLVKDATAKLNDALPDGAVTLTITYSDVRSVVDSANSLTLTLLTAFSIAAVVAAAIVVANAVAGVAIAARRDIGIMKAIGYTRSQVVRVLVGVVLAPALVGCVIGVPLGAIGGQRLVDRTAEAIGLPAQVAPPVLTEALLGLALLALTAIAAAIPAAAAARPTVAAALTRGPALQSIAASRVASAIARLPVPYTWSLGLHDSMLRPVRSLRAGVTLLLGVAALVLAYGLSGTFDAFAAGSSPDSTYAVQVDRLGDYSDGKLMSLLGAQPETKAVVAVASIRLNAPNLSEPVEATAYRGDARQLGFQLLTGRWYDGPGEVVVQQGFLRDTGLHVGQRFDGRALGQTLSLNVTGEDFGVINGGHVVRMDWSTYQQLRPDGEPTTYLVKLAPGTDAAAFADRIEADDPQHLGAAVNSSNLAGPLGPARQVVAVLAVVLALIAMVGVFNTILFNTRERSHELATLKAIGMAPGRLIVMVLVSAGFIGLIAGLVGIPLGLRIHYQVLTRLGGALGTDLPGIAYDVFHPPAVLAVLALGGILLAVIGALLPARAAARASVTSTLQTE
ncbi:MAG TPA: FtsX-like permease family protein [Candidatus Dormibacteraeota bacterium]